MPELRRTSSEVRGSRPPVTGDPPEKIEELIPGAETSSGFSMVNPEFPVEAEADLWGWFRAGVLQENIERLVEKNVSPEMWTFLKAWAAGLNPNTYVQAVKQTRGAVRQAIVDSRRQTAASMYGRQALDHGAYAR